MTSTGKTQFHNPEEYRQYLTQLAHIQLGAGFQGKLDASDVVQQTLLDVHRNQADFQGTTEAEWAAWLRKILKHNLLDAVRRWTRDKRNVHREISLEASIHQSSARIEKWLADDRSSPSERAEKNEQLLHLSNAIAQLPDGQREAIELFHLQGCTLAETAQYLGRTESAVGGLLYRGLKELRRQMDRMFPDSCRQTMLWKDSSSEN